MMNERDCRHGLPKNNCPRCEDEKYIAELEDALRWRKYEEKPDKFGEYITICTSDNYIVRNFWCGEWFESDVSHWLPIPPMEDE